MVGTRVSHYRVVAPLGEGGMGVVYLAEDEQLERKVALKFIAPSISADPSARARLIREARTAGVLDHPNIATVYEAGEGNGQLFVAMAYYPGDTLKARIARGPLPVDEAACLSVQEEDLVARVDGVEDVADAARGHAPASAHDQAGRARASQREVPDDLVVVHVLEDPPERQLEPMDLGAPHDGAGGRDHTGLERRVDGVDEVVAGRTDLVLAIAEAEGGLGGNDQLIAIRAQVSGEDAPEILLGRARRRPIVVGQIEVRDAMVEGAEQHLARVLL